MLVFSSLCHMVGFFSFTEHASGDACTWGNYQQMNLLLDVAIFLYCSQSADFQFADYWEAFISVHVGLVSLLIFP